MKKEIIGILICTLLISVAVAPVVNALTIEKNEINEVLGSNRIVKDNIKLNTPQATPWHHNLVILFGLISNLEKHDDYCCFKPYWVIEFTWDDEGFDCWIIDCIPIFSIPDNYIGILTNHFIFVRYKLDWGYTF